MTLCLRRALPAALVVVLLTQACASAPPTLTTPEARATFYAVQMTEALGLLQRATIAANEQKLINDATAVGIVSFTVRSFRVLKETPEGWFVVTRTAWAEAKAQFGAAIATSPALTAAAAAVDAIIQVIQTGKPPAGGGVDWQALEDAVRMAETSASDPAPLERQEGSGR